MYKEISTDDFRNKFLENSGELEIIDVREKYEFEQIRIKWSKLVPMQELESYLNNIDWKKNVIFVCRTWGRSGYITNILNQNGYDSKNLAGWVMMLQMNCQECMESGAINSEYFE